MLHKTFLNEVKGSKGIDVNIVLLFTDTGTVKASYPTTLSKDIEELRHGIRRYPQAFNQGLNETSTCKYLMLCYKL